MSIWHILWKMARPPLIVWGLIGLLGDWRLMLFLVTAGGIVGVCYLLFSHLRGSRDTAPFR